MCVVVAAVLVTMVGGAGTVAALARVAVTVVVAGSLVAGAVGLGGVGGAAVAIALVMGVRLIVAAVLVTVVASPGAGLRVLVGVLVAVSGLRIAAISVTVAIAIAVAVAVALAVVAVAVGGVVRCAVRVLVVADDTAAQRGAAGALTIGTLGIVVHHDGAADDGVVTGEVEQDVVGRGRGDCTSRRRALVGDSAAGGVLVWVVLTVLVLLLERAELIANITTVAIGGSVLVDLEGDVDDAGSATSCCCLEECAGSVFDRDGPAWVLGKLERHRIYEIVCCNHGAGSVLGRLQRTGLVSDFGRRVLLVGGIPA